ncbi:ankyrin-2-like isoform X4 [Daphnia pulex]|uniref:ankyrin-2-like isoform X4 n=1 Tax=Daphnia pulex TaxID=6669 RepID=UPI001EDF5A8A|nr:ankyrin-2-like isoform X4 [Daphnia pulex]
MANESEQVEGGEPVATAKTLLTTTTAATINGNGSQEPSPTLQVPSIIPSIKITKSDAKAGFLRSARDGHLDKVLDHLKNNTDINTSNANGLNALHLASKEGHVDVVTELLKRGAAVDSATKKGNTALHIASLAGQEEVVKILVLQGASVNVQSQNGFTPLYMAAQENHDGVVRFLLANGANQSLATEDGFTPLAVALQQGHDKVVSVLLENDTRGKVRLPALHIAAKKDDCKAAALLLQSDHNPDVTSKSGFTPLHIAAHYGNENIASLLVQKGADVNFLAKHHITPLHVAAKWGKANMAALLLDRHAQLEAKTRDGLTPLHCAARSGHETVVDLLLERGAPISSKTKNGLAPLHMAAQGDHVDAGRILLHHKAPVDEVTVDYLTALHVAAHCGHVRVAKLLLDRKADPNSRALNGFTPLHIACKKNRIKVIELLLKHGASIEATTESGLTPLHVASFMGCMNIVIYLLQHGANANAPTMRGEAPLHLAARANQTDIVRILLRNNAQVDARAREQQTPLHIASRLGNVDIVMLLLQHSADLDAVTKDMYTPLHIAAKEGQDEVAAVLLEHGANNTAATKRGFTPLHLAAKYGNIKVARLLIQKDAPVDAQGKNGVTPLHVASHYDHQSVALLLLDKGASPHAAAKNGYTPLHIAAKKNQMDIATTLLEYGAQTNAESKAGFTPLHLSAQEGHTDMSTLLMEHQAEPNYEAKNGLTPLHLCAQEDRVNVAAILVKNNAEINAQTKSGYTPLHVACHFGQMNMVRFLLGHQSQIDAVTSQGYTPMHQAAQQGHPMIVNLLLESGATPNAVTSQGQTALSIAQKLGYITVIETLKVVTETTITTTTTTIIEEKYRVQAPETMQETFMSDSEDEGGEDGVLGDHSYRYLTVDEMKSLGDDSMPMDGMGDERRNSGVEESILAAKEGYAQFSGNYAPDNVDLARQPVSIGNPSVLDDSLWSLASKGTGMWRSRFLVSFMVDARGGAMRGCRHSGVRVIIPPRKAACPMRITCRYLKKDKLVHPPPLMEGEALASRILELGPSAAKFLGPVIIEVPHFAALRGKEREIIVLRSDNGETWREHTLEATEEAVQEVLNESFDGEDMGQLEDMNTHRITRILTTDFPQYFAIVSRVRQEVHAIGPDGGMVSSSVVPQVQAVFPPGALTKKIKVGLQAQPIQPELVVKLLGNRVAVSPIVTVEPRRRKFHRPITLTIPVPQAAARGMINQYSGDTPTLRLLCSITGNAADVSTGGTSRAQWEDVTGSTPLTFVNDCVSFTTTVSARFWLMDCRNVAEAAKMATDLYREAINVPFMAKFVVFAKRHEPQEARLRVFCMTDDKEEKTLEQQEHFVEVAKSRDVEVLETKSQYLEFAGNLVPITKSGEQLALTFRAFRENRLPFTVRVKDNHADPIGRIAFMREARAGRGEPPQTPICNLNIVLPSTVTPETARSEPDLLALQKKYGFLHDVGLVYATNRPEAIHKADLRLSDICNLLGRDWIPLAQCLEIPDSDLNLIDNEYPDNTTQQAMVMLKLWMAQSQNKVTGNALEKALRKIGRDDIVNRCIYNVELVTDDLEKAVAKTQLDQSGFDNLRDELGADSTRNTLQRDTSLDVSFDEQDLMKDSESIDEIPEKREEEEQLNLQEVSEVISQEIKTDIPQKEAYDAEPVSQRIILHEEKGICDSREAEKDIEIPQPVHELESGDIYQEETEPWGTRQSTVEERVIDRYVIDTHPTPMFDPLAEDIPVEQLPTNEEEEEGDEVVEEPVVVAASAPKPRQQQPIDDEPEVLHSSSSSFAAEEPVSCVAPAPVERVAAVEQPRTYEPEQESEEEQEEVEEEPAVMATSTPARQQQRVFDEPEALNASFWNPPDEPVTCDDQFLEQEFTAALQGDEIDDVNKFSPELLSRSLEQPKSNNDAKVRMSTSKTPPSSPFEAIEAFTQSQMYTSQPEAVPAQVALAQSETLRSEDLDTSATSHVDVQEEHWTEEVEANEPAAVSDARLTSAGNTAASAHQSLVTNPPIPESQSPETADTSTNLPTSRIPVLSKRQNLSRSVSEQPQTSASKMPVPTPRVGRMIPGYFSSADHPSSTDVNAGSSAESIPTSIQENVESYSVRKQFWEEVASGTSSTSSSSSTRTRQTKSERSSLIVTDESFGPVGQRETKSERSSAVLSEEDIYEVGRYTITKVSTSETVIDTTHESVGAAGQEIIEELQLVQHPIDQSSSKVEEIQTVRTEETTVTRLSGKFDNPIVLEETVTGSSHRERIGREEYIYSSGDESVSLRAEDVESQSGVVLPGGRQVVTEEFAKSSKIVYKDGQPVFVEEFQYDQRQQPADSPPLESAPTGGFEDSTTAESTTGDWTTADSVEVNVDSQEHEVPDISIVHQESFGGGVTSSGESQEEGETVAGMAFINTAFIGVDHIDIDHEPAAIARSVSPFEVARGEAYVIGTYGPDFDAPVEPEEEEEEEEASPPSSPQRRLTFEMPQEAIVAEEVDECPVSSQPRSRTTSLDSQDLETYGSEGEAEEDEQDPSQVKDKVLSYGLSFQEEVDRELTPEEALQMAENLIEEIKVEAPRRAEMMSSTTPDNETGESVEEETETIQDVPQDAPQDAVPDAPQAAPQDATQDAPQYASQDAPQDVPQDVPQSLSFKEETEAKISEYIRQVDIREEVSTATSSVENVVEDTINWSLSEVHETSIQHEQFRVDIQESSRTVLPELDIASQVSHEQELISPEQVYSPERETTSTTSSGSKIDSSATFSENKTVSYEETSTTWTRKEEETIYFSAVETSGQRPSRPTSSDVDALISAGATTACSSEYETAFSSSSRSVNSSDFHSAVSSVSSRESMKSLDSTAGVASENSETLMASALEQDTTDRDLTPTDVSLDLNQMDAQFKLASDLSIPTVQHEEVGHEEVQHEEEQLDSRPESPFEMISPVDEGMVELEDEDDDDPAEDLIPPVMKRSQEMTFHPEPKPLRETGISPPTTPTPSEESPSLKSSLEAEKLLFDYVMSTTDEAAYLSTSTLSDGTSSTVIEAGGRAVKQDTDDQLSDEPEVDQEVQEDEAAVTALDASTITSRSGSLASGTEVEGIVSRQVTITSATVTHDSTQSINTQITTRRVVAQVEPEVLALPASMVPDITVQNASPVIDRRFSYPENVAGADLSELAKEIIEEVPSDEELEEEDEGYGVESAEPEQVEHEEKIEQYEGQEKLEQYEQDEELEQYVQAEELEQYVQAEELEAPELENQEEFQQELPELPELPEEPEETDYPEVDVEELISPPALVARRIDPPSMAGYNYEMSFERTEDEEEEAAAVEVEDSIEDLEKQKRWMEMQFEEAEDAAQGIFQPIPSRVQPLADIEEGKEDEESLNGSDRLVGRLKESLSSTPEFDVLSGRRYFTRSGDVDDLSVDSLQDFERLELELHAEKLRRQSNGSGSQESLNGRRIGSRSSGGDNISVNSLTEFERLERDMAEAAKLEERARQQEAALLSEIEEGHESQTSESESCETLSGQREGDDTEEDDDDDYEQRMFEIDEIIRQAQTNIEQFETELTTEVKETVRSSRMESTGSFNETTRSSVVDMKTESVDSVDSIEPDFLAGGSTSQRTAAIYRSCIRTEIKYSSDDIQQPDSLAGGPDSLDVFGPSSVDSLDSNARSRTGHESDSLQAMVGAESSSDSAPSSSREDLPRDSTVQRPTAIFRPATCSSDSLEQTQSSSRATGFDSDSIMSGSMTSSMGSAAAITVPTSETLTTPSGAPVYTETTRTVELSPEIRKVTFHGPDVDEQMKDFVSQFAPGEDIQEVEVTDPVTGNVFVTRVTQRRAFVDAENLPAGEDNLPSRQAVEEYIRTRGPQLEDVDSFEVDDGYGNIQRVIRKRAVVDSTVTAVNPTTHSHASPSLSPNHPTAFQSTPATEPMESTPLPEMTSSGAARHDGVQPQLPSAPRDSISIDDDDDDEEAMEVDSHEHDWRLAEFAPNTTLGRQQATNSQLTTAEADDQTAASAACQQYDPTCSAISESEPSLPSQPDWSDSAQGGN